MANAFFNDTLPPFDGVDIGWGQDPNFPIGEYSVVPDAATAARRQFELYQDADGNIAMTKGTLIDTYLRPSNSGTGMGACHVDATEFDHSPIEVDASTTSGFWIKFPHENGTSGGEARMSYVGSIQADAFGNPVLIKSTSHPNIGYGDAIVESTEDFSYIFLATVTVDADGVATIVQSMFGPITLPTISYLVLTFASPLGHNSDRDIIHS